MTELIKIGGDLSEKGFIPKDVAEIDAAFMAVSAEVGGLSLGQAETEAPVEATSELARLSGTNQTCCSNTNWSRCGQS